jgi:ParB family chromosome partitioning protein
MAARKSGLGSGLEALFSENASDMSADNKNINVLRISHIEPKKSQPRKDFKKESLAELSESISKHGIIQPIVVRNLPNGYYQIIAGERRWRAAKMAGLSEVPVVIKNVDDMTAAEITMVENLQREDLNPIEEAFGYKYLAEQYNLTQDEISKKVAKSRSVITNALRLLSLPDEILKYIEEGEITAGHARAILSIEKTEAQLNIAQKVIKNSLSVRETEKIVKANKEENVAESENDVINEKISKKETEIYFKNLQSKISGIFGKKVVINASPKKNGPQSGKLEIEYKNNEELESIIKIICGDENIFEN